MGSACQLYDGWLVLLLQQSDLQLSMVCTLANLCISLGMLHECPTECSVGFAAMHMNRPGPICQAAMWVPLWFAGGALC